MLSLSVLLAGRDGTTAAVRSAGEPCEVPVGDYRVDLVTLWLADLAGGYDWGFVFSGTGKRWHSVARDTDVEIDPIGAPRFSAGRADPASPVAAGEEIHLRPWLTTTDGLLLNVVYRGRVAAANRSAGAGATIRLVTPGGRQLAAASSGFT
ncbi:MAG: hypothetical protein AB1726_01875 [Planctomycetota bacterium]